MREESSALVALASVLYACSVACSLQSVSWCLGSPATKQNLIYTNSTFCKIAEGCVLISTDAALKFWSVALNMLLNVSLQAMAQNPDNYGCNCSILYMLSSAMLRDIFAKSNLPKLLKKKENSPRDNFC